MWTGAEERGVFQLACLGVLSVRPRVLGVKQRAPFAPLRADQSRASGWEMIDRQS